MNWPSLLLNRYRVSYDPLLTERRIELAALVLSVFLVLQLLYGVARLFIISGPEVILPSADSLIVSELQHAANVSAQQSEDVRARPVFWHSRERVGGPDGVVAAEKPDAKKGEMNKVKLLGVFGSGDFAGVIVLVKGNKKRLLLGDKVVGWTLDSIDGDQAVFVDSGQSQKLVLERADAASVPVNPAVAEKGKTKNKTQKKPEEPRGLRDS